MSFTIGRPGGSVSLNVAKFDNFGSVFEVVVKDTVQGPSIGSTFADPILAEGVPSGQDIEDVVISTVNNPGVLTVFANYDLLQGLVYRSSPHDNRCNFQVGKNSNRNDIQLEDISSAISDDGTNTCSSIVPAKLQGGFSIKLDSEIWVFSRRDSFGTSSNIETICDRKNNFRLLIGTENNVDTQSAYQKPGGFDVDVRRIK